MAEEAVGAHSRTGVQFQLTAPTQLQAREGIRMKDAAGSPTLQFLKRLAEVRVPTKPATHSDSKEATYSDPKPAIIPI